MHFKGILPFITFSAAGTSVWKLKDFLSFVPSELHIISLTCCLKTGISFIANDTVDIPPRHIKLTFVVSADNTPLITLTQSGAFSKSIPFSSPHNVFKATGKSGDLKSHVLFIPTGTPSCQKEFRRLFTLSLIHISE